MFHWLDASDDDEGSPRCRLVAQLDASLWLIQCRQTPLHCFRSYFRWGSGEWMGVLSDSYYIKSKYVVIICVLWNKYICVCHLCVLAHLARLASEIALSFCATTPTHFIGGWQIQLQIDDRFARQRVFFFSNIMFATIFVVLSCGIK